MPAPLMSKDEVVDRLFAVFREQGYDGATLAQLSRGSGLGKSSLYHYFPGGKDDMAAAVLGRAGDWLRANLAATAEGPGTPRERLGRMLKALDAVYAGGKNACVIGNLVTGSARRRFQRGLRDTFMLWVGALERLAADSGVPPRIARSRAEDAVAAVQGAIILSGALADPTPFRRALRAIPDALLGATTER
jgi:TetR/AcrR family transcriptional regulator, lmrAB and yxaGH operons repressor